MYLLEKYCAVTGLSFALAQYSEYLKWGFKGCVAVQAENIVSSVTEVIALHKD